MPSAAQIEWPQGNPLFEVQWRAIAESLAGNGIRGSSDLVVSATGNALEIEVAAGTAFYIGQEYNLGSASTFTLSSGGSDDRWDTVYFDTSTSSAGVREGTAGTSPEPPDVSGAELLLAVIYVPANASDVPDSDVLNWRAQFSNEAEEIHYDDSTGVYGFNNVDSALDELQEAAQISSYPLAIGDLNAPYAPTNIASVNGYPFLNSDLENSTITVNAGTGLSTTNASIELGGSGEIAITSGDITTTEIADGTIIDTDISSSTTIARGKLNDERITSAVKTAAYTTAGEEVIQVDTSGGSFTVTLASADVSLGNFIAITDVGGATNTNALTISTESGENIDGGTSITLERDYGAKILFSDGTQWYTASGSAATGIAIEDNGSVVLDPATGIDAGSNLTASDNGDGSVTIDSDTAGVNVLTTGTFTHTGGSATSTTVAGVTSDQTANLYVEVGVDSDPSFSANYAWDYSWGEAWDDTNSEKDVTIDAKWDTDPGSGNDVVLDYRIYTLDVSVSKSQIQDLINSPNGNLMAVLLEDTESAEVTVPVPDGETLKVYRWGGYKVSDGTAPAGLTVELLDGSDTVQSSENTVNTENVSSPVASHGNASGSLSIFKLSVANETGNNYTTDGVGAVFAYTVE